MFDPKEVKRHRDNLESAIELAIAVDVQYGPKAAMVDLKRTFKAVQVLHEEKGL